MNLHIESHVPGVDVHSRSQLWRARIYVNGRRLDLGYFKTRKDAEAARLVAEIKYPKPLRVVKVKPLSKEMQVAIAQAEDVDDLSRAIARREELHGF